MYISISWKYSYLENKVSTPGIEPSSRFLSRYLNWKSITTLRLKYQDAFSLSWKILNVFDIFINEYGCVKNKVYQRILIEWSSFTSSLYCWNVFEINVLCSILVLDILSLSWKKSQIIEYIYHRYDYVKIIKYVYMVDQMLLQRGGIWKVRRLVVTLDTSIGKELSI